MSTDLQNNESQNYADDDEENQDYDNQEEGDDYGDEQQQDDGSEGGPDSPKYIRLRGLPWSATHQEILDFLKSVTVIDAAKGIHLVTSRWDGKNTGEAYVEVQNQQDVEQALKLNKAVMGHRYIEVFTATSKEAKEAMRKTSSHGNLYVVKLRGLPYAVTEQQIEEFFNGLEIKPDREGILFVMDRRGRATGEAFVQFESQEDTEQALGRNREKIGHRYIEIFRSSIAELKRASNGGGRPGPYDLKDRGGNRGGSDYGGGRNNMRGGNDWGNNGGGGNGFGVGANNTLGFNNLPGFTNSGNFGNGYGPPNNSGNFGGNNGGNFGGSNNGGNFGNNGGGGGNGGNFGNNGGGFGGNNRFNDNGGNFGNDFGDFNNFGNNRNNFNNGGGGNGGGGMNDFGHNRGGGGGGNFGGSSNFGNFGGGGGGGGGNSGNMGFNGSQSGGNFGPIGGGRGDNEFFTVHMRGLPYNSYENEVFKFFDPVVPANVRVNFNKKGLHSGTADAFFDTYEDAQQAMKRNKEQMGTRYIELFFDGKTKGNHFQRRT